MPIDYLADDAGSIAARLKELDIERSRHLAWETALGADLDGFAERWGVKRAIGEADETLRKRIEYVVYSGG